MYWLILAFMKHLLVKHSSEIQAVDVICDCVRRSLTPFCVQSDSERSGLMVSSWLCVESQSLLHTRCLRTNAGHSPSSLSSALSSLSPGVPPLSLVLVLLLDTGWIVSSLSSLALEPEKRILGDR